MKIIIHPTWACPLRCSYCSVHALGLERDRRRLPWRIWAQWTERLLPPVALEFSGGEPLAYPGLLDLLRAVVAQGHYWGITTNAVLGDAVRALAAAKLPRCLAVNVSIQPESPDNVLARAETLAAAGYPVRLNHVEHYDSPDVPETTLPINRIPYQAWAEHEARDRLRRICDAGYGHMCCDPAGNVYRCLVALQSGEEPLGTVFQHPETLNRDPSGVCDGGCTSCYLADPGSWQVRMRLAKEGE